MFNGGRPLGLIHTAAILSRETEKALFYHPRLRSEKFGSEARQVKQKNFSLLGQNDRRVTKALCTMALFYYCGQNPFRFLFHI